MIMRLIDLFETRAQEQVHVNPSVATLKALARNNKYHSARFVILNDGTVIAGDSEHHTHHSMEPFMGAWEVRGYLQYMGDNDYAYRSMEVYSALNKDHPIFRTWERMGIQNGNPDQSHLSEAPIKATLYTDPNYYGATVQVPKKIQEPIVRIPTKKITVFEPDTKFDDPKHAANLESIKAAIKKGAKLPPILVRRLGMKYQVVDGHHRFKAYRDLKIKQIPARIVLPQNITVVDKVEQSVQEAKSKTLAPQLYVPHPLRLQEHIKPQAMIWTSTAEKLSDGYTSAWVEWCADEMPDWLSNQGTLFDVKPGAKILTLNTDKDALAIAKHYGVLIKHPMDLFGQMPWDKISQDYDAVHHVPSHDRFANMFMSTWDVESTAWFNKTYLTNPRTVDVRSTQHIQEAWSTKYKKSINCNNPKGFSQRAHCAGRKRRQAGKPTCSKAVR